MSSGVRGGVFNQAICSSMLRRDDCDYTSVATDIGLSIEQGCKTHINKSAEHADLMLRGLNSFRAREDLCDVVLLVDGTRIPAHRLVLASCSSYFDAMFTGSLKESTKQEIQLKCIEPAVAEAIVSFLYTGTVNLDHNNVTKLLVSADLFEIKNLVNACCVFLKNRLSSSNCISLARFAETFNRDVLYKTAYQYVCKNFERVCYTEEFYHLSFSEVDRLLSDDMLNIRLENVVFEAMERWILFKLDDRNRYLESLLKCIRLSLMTVQTLTQTYEANQLIRASTACQQMVNEALQYHLFSDRRLNRDQVDKFQQTARCPPRYLCAVGGKSGLFSTLPTLELYDPQIDQWQGIKPGLFPSRYECGSAAINRKMFVIGGMISRMSNTSPCQDNRQCENYMHSKECYTWHLDTHQWTAISPLTYRRSAFAVTVLNREIFCLGGYDGNRYLTAVEKYEIDSNQWVEISPMLKCRSCFAATNLDGKIYAIGGYGPAYINMVEMYDPATNVWQRKSSMKNKRIDFGVAVINGFIYVVGGHSGHEHLSSVERFDPVYDHWTTVASLDAARSGLGVAILNGSIYVAGGHDGTTYFKTVLCYDHFGDKWKRVSDMASSRSNFAFVAV